MKNRIIRYKMQIREQKHYFSGFIMISTSFQFEWLSAMYHNKAIASMRAKVNFVFHALKEFVENESYADCVEAHKRFLFVFVGVMQCFVARRAKNPVAVTS